ncbi:MAG TPA: hypothetical protein VN408_04155 [Actinoplanes sp.]|nr:hypothetical protein [Actinoplanes sp.]
MFTPGLVAGGFLPDVRNRLDPEPHRVKSEIAQKGLLIVGGLDDVPGRTPGAVGEYRPPRMITAVPHDVAERQPLNVLDPSAENGQVDLEIPAHGAILG